MTLTRSKRMAKEPLLTLSAAKIPKRRKIVKNDVPVTFVENSLLQSRSSSSQHKCTPVCSGPRSRCSLNDILNTSDHNENENGVSAEIESIDNLKMTDWVWKGV